MSSNHAQVTSGDPRGTSGDLRVTSDDLRVTSGDLIVHVQRGLKLTLLKPPTGPVVDVDVGQETPQREPKRV